MSLSFNLQRLPSEALSVLHYLGQRGTAANTEEMETGVALSQRAIGRAIRRLVNYSLIQIDYNGAYQLTSNGRRAYQQLADLSASLAAADAARPSAVRRLTVVLPRLPTDAQPIPLYIGVNAASASASGLKEPVQLELRLSAIGGKLSRTNLSLDVPADRAAVPATLSLTAEPGAPLVRVRLDAFQVRDLDQVDAVGNMYFDLPTNPQSKPDGSAVPGQRAFSTDLALH